MLISEKRLVVAPSYRQFYLQRGSAEWASDRIPPDGYASRLQAVDGFVFVGTVMYGSQTGLTVQIHDEGPPLTEAADHVVEVPLTGSGSVAIFSWATEEPEAVVEPPEAGLRLRSSWFSLHEALTHPDHDIGGGTGPETLLLQLWHATPTDPRVVRWWTQDRPQNG